MLYQSIIVAFLATTAVAHPNHGHKHLHNRGTGTGAVSSVATGTGAPYSYGNTTAPYSNTTSSTVASTDSVSVVTVSVVPVAASSDSATASADTDDATCGSSGSTTTVTTVQMVTVTVDDDSASSTSAAAAATSAAVSTPSVSVAAYLNTTSTSAAASTSASSTSISVVADLNAEAVSSSATSEDSSSTSVAAASSGASTSSTSSSATSSSTSTSSSGKRGLAYTDISTTKAFSDTAISWAYDWSAYDDGTLPSGIEFVPEFWGPGEITLSDWTKAAEDAIAAGSTALLSINEPDESSQADLTAAEAAAAHIEYMNQFAGKASIGSPAVTNGASPMGLTYMQSFFDACDNNCTVDFMVIHWYSSYYDGVDTDFESYVDEAISVAAKNSISSVWITEFALTDASNDEQASFLNATMPWLDAKSEVGRYSFYMCSDGLLVSGSSISSDLGEVYVS